MDSSDHVFFSNRSAAYLSKGDGANALTDAEQCIQLNSQWAKGYSRKGAALHSLKRYDEAVAAYEAGLAIAPADAGLQSGLAEVKKAQSAPPSGGFLPPQLLTKLASHPKYGPKLADPAFMAKLQMLQTNPQAMLQDPEIMEIFGLLMGEGEGPMETDSPASNPAPAPKEEKKDTPPSPPQTEEEKRAQAAKDAAKAAKERGNALYKQKQFVEALAAYDEASSLDPKCITYLSNKAAVYIEMGDLDRAIEQCQEGIEYGRSQRAPYEDIAKMYQRMAAAYLKKDDFPTAKECYAKAQMVSYMA